MTGAAMLLLTGVPTTLTTPSASEFGVISKKPGRPGDQAFAALSPVDGPDVRGLPDGRLLHLRDTYPLETAWARPGHPGKMSSARSAPAPATPT